MTLQTDRLTIRPIVSDDWLSLKSIWEDQKHSPYARYDRPLETDDDSVRKRAEKWASFTGNTDHLFFAVCLNEDMIGYAVFHRREDGYETGYCFRSDAQGKGYARESISALIGYLRKQNIMRKITAGTALANTPSVRLLSALGFRQTGSEKVSFYTDSDGNPEVFDGGIFELNL